MVRWNVFELSGVILDLIIFKSSLEILVNVVKKLF